MADPSTPEFERRAHLLDVLAQLVQRGGPGSLLAPPVVPGLAAFPEPWRPTRGGVVALLRRLAWHAANPRALHVIDARLGAPPTERKPETRVALTSVRGDELGFRLEFVGADDVAGTLAHELGVAHAAVNRPDAGTPYRTADGPVIEIDPDRDLERGSIATVFLGLGVVAINGAFQEYRRPGRFNGGYDPLEYDVLRAGYVSMSDLAYLVAVQAVVRDAGIPEGLSPPQRDEVAGWVVALRADADALRERLGIPADAPTITSRPTVVAFEDVDVDDEAPAARPNAFRWRTNRGGVGMIAGAVLGVGMSVVLATEAASLWIVMATASSGHVLGRRVRVPRCSGCATVVPPNTHACPRCGAMLRGDIDRLADRLEAEEAWIERDRPDVDDESNATPG